MLVACIGPDLSLGVLADAMDEAGATLQPGFGAAWYAPDDLPVAYCVTVPAILDPNLDALGRALYADCWLLQAGSEPPPAAPQPLVADDLACAVEFAPDDWTALRAGLRERLDEETEAALDYTDAGSGVFALLQDLLDSDEEMTVEDAMLELVSVLDELLDGMPATLLVTATDGEQIWALRRAWQAECPPLHWCTDAELFDGAQMVASEPLGEGVWQLLPEQHLLVLDRETPPELIAA